MSYLASLDQSTTSTKFSLYHPNGQLVAQQIIEHQQFTPTQGLLQHDPLQIIKNIHIAISNVIQKVKKDHPDFTVNLIRGLGVTNQRETVVCWDQTGKPYYNAIVWCDTRCKQICDKFTKLHGNKYKQRTGLPVSTYFTFFKILWLIENVAQVRQAVEQDRIRFGTIDSWVVFNLTGRFVTDASNASRTFMCGLRGEWDEELINLAGLKPHMLPEIVDSFGQIGQVQVGELKGVEVRAILGDQQSSAYAHQLKKNQAKITYGTGCFLLINIGHELIIHESLITTIIYKHKGVIEYAYECSVECGGGTLNWARRTGLFKQFNELNNFEDVTNQELYFFPSFGQIYAPFWKSGVQGGLVGISLATTRKHIFSAILESILFRVYDNLILKDCEEIAVIFADGGMTRNTKMMQSQCDLLNKRLVHRERDTCWGVAKGVLTSCGVDFGGFQGEKSTEYDPRAQEHDALVNKYGKWRSERKKYYGWNQ